MKGKYELCQLFNSDIEHIMESTERRTHKAYGKDFCCGLNRVEFLGLCIHHEMEREREIVSVDKITAQMISDKYLLHTCDDMSITEAAFLQACILFRKRGNKVDFDKIGMYQYECDHLMDCDFLFCGYFYDLYDKIGIYGGLQELNSYAKCIGTTVKQSCREEKFEDLCIKYLDSLLQYGKIDYSVPDLEISTLYWDYLGACYEKVGEYFGTMYTRVCTVTACLGYLANLESRIVRNVEDSGIKQIVLDYLDHLGCMKYVDNTDRKMIDKSCKVLEYLSGGKDGLFSEVYSSRYHSWSIEHFINVLTWCATVFPDISKWCYKKGEC